MCLDCGVTNLDICSGSAHPSSRLHQLAGVAMSKPGLFVPVSFNCSVSECFLTNPHACSHLCNQSVQGIYFAAQKAATLSGPSPKTFSLERDLPGFCHVHVARTLWRPAGLQQCTRSFASWIMRWQFCCTSWWIWKQTWISFTFKSVVSKDLDKSNVKCCIMRCFPSHKYDGAERKLSCAAALTALLYFVPAPVNCCQSLLQQRNCSENTI